ncbi:MAG: hypothetical protein ACM3ML_25715 [Micromonosporaceae bacterium]
MSLMTLDCPECHEERPFEALHDPADCPDRTASPDGECPELACVECGAGLFWGFAIPQDTTLTAGTPGASPSRPPQAHRPRRRPERAA